MWLMRQPARDPAPAWLDHTGPGPDVIAVGLLLALVLTCFAPWLAGAGGWEAEDNLLTARPTMLYLLDRLGHGELPLWNSCSALGAPFAGQGVSLFDPFNLLGLLPAACSTMAILVLQLAIAGISMYGLLRALAKPPAVALTGALAYLGAAWPVNLIASRLYLAPFVWMPLAIALQIEAGRRASLRWTVAAAAAWSFAILGGYPSLWPMVLAVTPTRPASSRFTSTRTSG